jgi:hypothetical protein
VREPATGTVPPWALFVPRDANAVDRRVLRPSALRRQLARLAPGSWVSIVDDHRLSHWRLRRAARSADLVVERELVVVPGAGATVVVDAAAPDGGLALLRWAWARWWAKERVLLARHR